MLSVLSTFKDEDVVIVQDNNIITKEFFEKYSNYIAYLVENNFPKNEIIGIKSDNNALGLALIIGVIKSGRDALPISTINNGSINDYLIDNTNCKHFIGYGTDIDHSVITNFQDIKYKKNKNFGSIIISSSGSTGVPKITLFNPLFKQKKDVIKRKKMMTSRIGKKYKSIFYSAPMMSGCMVYFNIWQFGVSIFATNEKPSINLINDIILKNNIKMTSLRPSMIDRFILEGADSISNAEIIMTAGAPLTNSQIKYCRDTLNIKHIVDCYATTECGIIAMRDAINEENFELFPAVKIKSFNENGTVIEHSQTIGFWDNKKLKKTSTRFIDDIIELNDNKIKLLGRKSKKIKVNGFSIPSELVRQSVLEISGVSDCKVFASGAKNSSDILNLEYTGKNLNDIDILNSLSEKLPFYCIPQKIKYTPNYYWGLAK